MSIVVGFVPTREGRAALRVAADECELRRTALVVVNSSHGGRSFDAADIDSFEADLAGVRSRLEAAGLVVESRTLGRGNEAAEDLIAVADEEKADCVVIGLRRRSPVGKLILGSNAQRILLDAGCPVLAVKADDSA